MRIILMLNNKYKFRPANNSQVNFKKILILKKHSKQTV